MENHWRRATCARLNEQIVVNCGDSEVQITPFANDMVRVRILRTAGAKDPGSWAMAKEKWDLPKHGFEQDAKSITVTLEDVTVKITKSPLRISFLTPQGEVINQDDPSKGMAWDGGQVRVWKTMPQNELYYGFGEKTGMLDRRDLAVTNWNTDIPAYTPEQTRSISRSHFSSGCEAENSTEYFSTTRSALRSIWERNPNGTIRSAQKEG